MGVATEPYPGQAWRLRDSLEAAKTAHASRKAAVDALRELCLNDEEMIASVYRRYGR
jgi:hypothetical protein